VFFLEIVIYGFLIVNHAIILSLTVSIIVITRDHSRFIDGRKSYGFSSLVYLDGVKTQIISMLKNTVFSFQIIDILMFVS